MVAIRSRRSLNADSFLFIDAMSAAILPKMKAVVIEPVMTTPEPNAVCPVSIGATSFPVRSRTA